MKKLVLLLLGWAVIGQGMWYRKGGVGKANQEHYKMLKAVYSRLSSRTDEIFFQLYQYEMEQLKEKRAREPKDKITFAVNNGASLECSLPHRITHTHKRRVESISDLVVCNTDMHVAVFPTWRDRLKITLTTCASEQMCNKYFKRRGSIQKLDEKLYIVPPQFDHKLTSICIEHPSDRQFNITHMSFEEFMEQFGSSNDSTGSSDDWGFLSDGEIEGQE